MALIKTTCHHISPTRATSYVAGGVLNHHAFKSALLCLLLWFFTGLSPGPALSEPPPAPVLNNALFGPAIWSEPDLNIETIRKSLEATAKSLDEIDREIPDNSLDGLRRTALRKRRELLEELLQVVIRIQTLTEGKNALSKEKKLDREIEKIKELPAPLPPTHPTQEEFMTIKATFEKQSLEVENLMEEIKSRYQLMDQIPALILKAKERRKESEDLVQKLETELSDQSSDDDKKILSLKIDNLRLDIRIAIELVKLWEEEQNYEKKITTYRDKKLEFERLKFKREEHYLSLYRQALDKHIEDDLKIKKKELITKAQTAALAKRSSEKFFTLWEAKISRVGMNIANLNKFKAEVSKEIFEQDKLLKDEVKELDNLKSLIKKYGSKGPAAEIIKNAFKSIGPRRLEIRMTKPQIVERLADLRSRRVEIDRLMYGLREMWQNEFDEMCLETSNSGKGSLKSKAENLFDNYRQALIDEKRLLVEITTDGHKLEFFPVERAAVLDDLEKFTLSKILWIQDAPPLNLKVVKTGLDEIAAPTEPYSLVNWFKKVLSSGTMRECTATFQNPITLFFSLIIFLFPPISYFYLRIRLQRFLDRLNSIQMGKMLITKNQFSAYSWGMVHTTILPIFFIMASQLIDFAGFPAYISPVLGRLFFHVGFFFLLLFSSRFLFNRLKTHNVFSHISHEIVGALSRSLYLIFSAYLLFLMPWDILRSKPFKFEALPRIGYTLFEVCAAFSLFLLTRHASPLTQYLCSTDSARKPNENLPAKGNGDFFVVKWQMASLLILISMMIILVLDVSGYRFGAAYLTKNGLYTLLTVFGFIAFHRKLLSVIEKFKLDKTRQKAIPKGKAPLISPETEKFVSAVLVLACTYILTVYWGINVNVIHALNDYTLYTITTAGGHLEFVSAADFLKFIVTLLFTLWLLKHLPGIYNLTISRYIKLETGLYYAVVTILRYVLFILGVLIALSAIHLDLGRIGWLLAAISVGIGFGLQEIFANFVSGIILLVERPIRVGDRITVGDICGDVTRINIRATRVLNLDKQEILVPNRDLITREVTNWTLSNKIIRLVIKIGVAYGTDINKVREILLSIAEQHPQVLESPPPEAHFVNHGDSSLDFEFRVFVPGPGLELTLTDQLNRWINHEFMKENIEIPFPQHEVHIK